MVNPQRMGRGGRIKGYVCAALVAALAAGALTAANAGPARLLPDLRPLPPETVVGPVTAVMYPAAVEPPLVVDGCYADERVRKDARRCLRFDGIVGNFGEGAFELAYVRRKGAGVAAIQRVYASDGSHADRYAIDSEFHPTHAHFHVRDFYVARLWVADPDGRRGGRAPVARGDKNGFCPQDSDRLDGGSRDGRRYTCLLDGPDGTRALQVVGISPGWRDVYPADLPDQFVEITGVPDGRYVLELEIDPNDVFVEADDDNRVCTLLELHGDEVDVVEPEVVC
jgi:hypothetical protein